MSRGMSFPKWDGEGINLKISGSINGIEALCETDIALWNRYLQREVVCDSLHANAFEKGMTPSFSPDLLVNSREV